MTYYSYPNPFGDIYFNWTLMKNGMDNDGVALLLRLLGDEDNLDMEYHLDGGDEGSGASPSRVRPTFINMGYSDPGNLQNFSSAYVRSYLDKTLTNEPGGGPVFVCGYGNNSNGKRVGHAWVIDGYIQYESKGSLVPGGYLLHDILFHCVWGWDGDSNGYFYWDKANRFSGDPIEKEDDDYSYNLENPLFDDDVKFIGGFVPNNQ